MTSSRRENRRMDATDGKILRLLARNARASYTDLGTAVGLSPNAVAQRMRRLERERVVLGYRAVLDPALTGRGVCALVQLRTAVDSDAAVLEERLTALPDVTEVLDLAGSVDYMIKLRCVDQARLYDVVQLIRTLPGVTEMETRPVLREVLRR